MLRGTPENAEKDGYISNPFKAIQDRNIMVTRQWDPSTVRGVDPNLWIFFSHALDRVEEEDGWIFMRSGDAFARQRPSSSRSEEPRTMVLLKNSGQLS